MQTTPSIPIYTELGQALQATGDFLISSELLNMFKKRTDLLGDDTNAIARFDIARSIYASVAHNTPRQQPAIFYSLRDREGLKNVYLQQHFEIKNKIIEKLNHFLIEKKLIAVFEGARDLVNANSYIFLGLSAEEKIQLQQYEQHIANARHITNLLLNDMQQGRPIDVSLQQILGVIDETLQQNLIMAVNNALQKISADTVEEAVQGILTEAELTQMFIETQTSLGHMLGREEEIQLEICQYYIHSPQEITNLSIAIQNGMTIADWFNDEGQRQVINNISNDKFYDIPVFAPTMNEAMTCGRIYAPGPLQNHNWGVNAAWVLGLIHQKVPIILKSLVNDLNQNRANFNQSEIHNPSAFALEIAIVLSAGYRLDYSASTGQVTLRPSNPSVEFEIMDGIPGNGILPTKANQIALYQEVQRLINNANADIIGWQLPLVAHTTPARPHNRELLFRGPRRAPLAEGVTPRPAENRPLPSGTGRVGIKRGPPSR